MPTPGSRRPGRPPSVRSRQAVLEAALAMLAERGAGSITIDAIAVRARVSKATIYRHWHGKEAICREAVAAMQPATGPPCNHLDSETALVECATALARALTATQHGYRVAAIAAAAAGDRDLHRIWEEAVIAPHRQALARTVRVAQSRDEVVRDADPSLVGDLVVAPVVHRLTSGGSADLEDYARAVAIAVWRGLRTR